MAFFKKATNTILSIPEIEVKVKEATNNEPWGPSGSQMTDISRATHNYADFSIIMNVIWKRLNDQGKYWRHVYKALLLLDYLLKNGSDQVVRETKVHLVEIQTLTQFAHIDEKNKDVGVSVRERAKHIVELVSDDNRIKQEREKCLKNQGKWSNAISSEGYAPPPSSSSSNYSSPPMGSSPPVSAAPSQQRRKDDSSDDEVTPPQQPGQRPAYAQAEMYAVMSAGHPSSAQGGAPQYPQAATQPQYPQAAMQPQYGQPAPSAYGSAAMGNNPYSSPQGSGGAAPTTAAAAGLFGPAGGQGAAPPTYASPQASAGSQGALFGAPQGGNPYAQPAGGFQGNYGAPASAKSNSSEEFFNPRVGQPAAAPAPSAYNPYSVAAAPATAPATAPYNPYSAAAAAPASATAPAAYNPYSAAAAPASAPASSNPFGGASVNSGNSSGVTAAQLGLFGQPQSSPAPAPAASASPFAPVSAPVMPAPAASAAPSASPFAPASPVTASASGGAPAGMQVMYTPQGQPIYVMNSAPPANAPVYVLVNGQLVPASQASGAQQ